MAWSCQKRKIPKKTSVLPSTIIIIIIIIIVVIVVID
jgi:hypothetical protein